MPVFYLKAKILGLIWESQNVAGTSVRLYPQMTRQSQFCGLYSFALTIIAKPSPDL